MLTIEEQLKLKILDKYRSVRAFTVTIDIPYSTMDSVLKNGIAKSGVNTMLKIFADLDLEIESIPTGTLSSKFQRATSNLATEEEQLLTDYRALNLEGQEKASEYISDLVATGRYKKADKLEIDVKDV